MKRVVLDIETNMAHDRIWLCVTKDIDTREVKVWKEAGSLKDYLKDTTLIIGHNAISFDCFLLNKLWRTKIRKTVIHDTLVVSRLLDPSREKGHSLDAWGKELTSQKLDYRAVWLWLTNRSSVDTAKGMEFDEPHLPLLTHYCAKDVKVTEALYFRLLSEVESKGFSSDSVKLEHEVAAIMAEQTRNGFKLDVKYATMLLTDVKGRLDTIYEKMQERWPQRTVERISENTGKRLKDAIVVFNPGSRQQIGEKLKELGWKPEKLTPTGHPIVDETVLKALNIPEAQLIAEYLMLQKRVAQITSWTEALGSDGRVHGKVITNGAVTGRMTHSTPNMAQVPNASSAYGPECRECWTVDEGNVLVGCDASGLELRMLAHYMQDREYIKIVTEGTSKNGTDVHTVNQRAAGLATRDSAKTFIYAFLYGAGDAKIGSIIGRGERAGRRLRKTFLSNIPALANLITEVKRTATEKNSVRGLDGRRLWIRSEHSALNTLLQGAGAIVMKKALVLMHEKLSWRDVPFKLVANVHDEFQIECEEKYGDEVGIAAVEAIREAGVALKLLCPLDGEYKIGRNWKETH